MQELTENLVTGAIFFFAEILGLLRCAVTFFVPKMGNAQEPIGQLVSFVCPSDSPG